MVQPYRVSDPWSGVSQGMAIGNALRDDVSRSRAGAALSRGDYAGGANALLTNGDIAGGLQVQRYGQQQLQRETDAQAARKAEALKFAEEAAGRLAEIHRSGKDPAKTLAAFDQFFAPRFKELGEDDAEIGQLRAGLASDPDTTLMALGAGAAKELGYELRNAGDEVLVFKGGQLINRYRGAKTANVAEGGALYELPGTGGSGIGDDVPAAGDLPPPPAPPETETASSPADNIRSIVDRLVQGGARITSAKRSPADNARVGGAKNSYHLRGQAFDIVPPQGMSMAQLAQELRATGVDFAELINEGDHVHVAWNDAPKQPGAAPTASDGPRLLVQRPKAPKPQQVRLTPAEVEAAGYQPGSVVFRDPQTGEETVKQGPGAGSGKITDGQRHTAALTYRVIGANDRLNELAKRGLYKPTSPLETLFNVDKNGAVRLTLRTEQDRLFMQAAREWLAPILRKDTGAAVTDEELRNYMSQYIPAFEDSPQGLWNKAQARDRAMSAIMGESSQAYEDQYGKPARWQVLTDPRGKSGGASAAPKEAVDMLKSDPSPTRRQQFDAVFGKGAAQRALGGR